ncbi:MAG: universal stress protein UspA [Maledivibacter sp.]|jgi:K+-sensing histidine kinase KdpD|nr:universal stress protein UspA [Maledivibacter sp.]
MKKNKDIMVCVTQQKSCERLIERGAEVKNKLDVDGQLHVIHVVKDGWKYFGKLKESDALEYLFDISKSYGADLTVIKAPDIEETLMNFAEKNNIEIVVMGESLEKSSQQNMIERFKRKLDRNIVLEIVPVNEFNERAV